MTLLTAFEELVQSLRPCFQQERTFERARALAYASVLTFGRHTVTRLIGSKNEQHRDWSADYRLFSQRQWCSIIFRVGISKSIIAMKKASWVSAMPKCARPCRCRATPNLPSAFIACCSWPACGLMAPAEPPTICLCPNGAKTKTGGPRL